MGKCTKCGNSITGNFGHFLVTPIGVVCESCQFKSNPPKIRLVLQKNTTGKPLYNVTQKIYEDRMRIEDFKKCGWFMREKREDSGFIFYKMEFHGTTKCTRFLKANYPSNYCNCTRSMGCRSQVAQGPFTENYIG